MGKLEELRETFLKRGFKNPDVIISMTGFNNYKVNGVFKAGNEKIIDGIKKAEKTENEDLILKATDFGYKNFGLAAHVMRMQGLEAEKLLKETSSENFKNVAFAIEKEGVDSVKKAFSLKINHSSISAVAKAINAVGFDRVKEKINNTKEGSVREIALKLAAEKKEKQADRALDFYEGAIPISAVKNPENNLKIIKKFIEKTEEEFKNGVKSIPRERLVDLAQGWKLYNNQVENFIREKDAYSIKDVDLLREKLRNSISAERLKSKGVRVFPAVFRAKKQGDSFTLGLYPTPDDLNEIKKQSALMLKKPLEKHVEGAICYARFKVEGKKLIVSNLQSNITNSGLNSRIRKKYEDWQKVLILTLDDYASKMGLNEIWLTTAEHQMRQWIELHPKTAFEVYAETPKKMGFKLRETNPTFVEGVNSNLFWVKKTGSGLNYFKSVLKENESSRIERLKEILLQKVR
ncbi:MAG: hypothetical protein M1594_01855 [Candidatus Marsarchaeota archaeon]|nr:hypothetical protein [Candidatus Marsarchaeota archaeon]